MFLIICTSGGSVLTHQYFLRFLLMWAISCPYLGFGQDTTQFYLEDKELFFTQNNWGISLGALLGGGEIIQNGGVWYPDTGLGIGFYGGGQFTKNFNESWGLELGCTLGVYPFKLNYNIPAEVKRSNVDSYFPGTEYITNMQAPILIVIRKKIRRKFFLQLKSGVNIRYVLLENIYSQIGSIDDLGRRLILLQMDNYMNNNFTFNPMLSISGMHFFRNYTAINIDLIYNHSFTSMLSHSQYFLFDHSGTNQYQNEGRYETRGSYLGLELSYTFSGIRKFIRQAKKGK